MNPETSSKSTSNERPRLAPAERRALASELARIVGPGGVLAADDELIVYDVDGFTLEKFPPDLVVLPRTTEEVSAILSLAHARGVPVVARGAGTGLAGGALAEEGGIVLTTARMDRLLELDPVDRLAVVQPGLVNLHLTQAAAPHELYYAPDPSSQMASTLGGNVATNAGGPHCLKYGQTHQHVRGLTFVLVDGTIVRAGGASLDPPGLNLVGTMVGSEGTFGVVTEIVVGLLPRPEAVRTFLAIFESVEAAGEAVTTIIARGIVPAALEMLDHLTIVAVEPGVKLGLPLDAGAALLVELDGIAAGMDRRAAEIHELCRAAGAREIREAKDEAERALLWKARKGAFGAMGRIANGFYIMDGVVPRTKLPEILRRIDAIARRFDLRIANVFHAGDGNLHPNVLYDVDDPDSVARALHASHAILEACVELGGSLSGEHGIGNEKRELMGLCFSAEDLETFARLRRAFDPSGRLNPRKILPMRPGCGEVGALNARRRAAGSAVAGSAIGNGSDEEMWI
ncbi:MAG: FAD-linked oxidase C-terminal domain-containing protein [Candidatus Eiseniibacteriota bacterium]